MVRTQVQLTEKQLKKLKKASAQRGVSVSSLIREAVDRHVELNDPFEIRERLVRAAASFKSGRSDISKEHDRYLGDAYKP